jgi:ribonuclease P protein component
MDFKRVYSAGNSYATSHLVLYWYENQKKYNRFGFSISKKIGKAVVRNKLRRRLKEIIRLNEDNLVVGYDLIIIARKPVVRLEFTKIKKDVFKLFRKSGIWCEESQVN